MTTPQSYSDKYLHLGESIDLDAHVLCVYKIKSSQMTMREAAAAIATEQSTGTWTDISTLKEENFLKRSGKVIEIDGMDLAVLRGDHVARNEVYFDRSPLGV